MTDYRNGFEQVASGTALSTTNSGLGGDPFDSVSVGASATITFDTTHSAHGLASCKFAGGSAVTNYISKTFVAATALATVRMYCYFPAKPAALTTICGFYSGSTVRARLGVNNGPNLSINAPAGSATSVNAIPLNQWFRVDMTVNLLVSGGSVTVNLYDTMDSATPTETFTLTGVSLGGTADRMRLGVGTAPSGALPTFWVDEVAWNDTGSAIGPVTATVKAQVSAWNPTGGLSSGTFSLPSGLAVGDPLFLGLASNGAGMALSSVPSGWTVADSGTVGSMSWLLMKRTGGWQTADGTSLSLTFTGNVGVEYCAFGLDGTLYDPNTFALGAHGDRTSSVTTSVAAAVGSVQPATLVLGFEKASAHSGGPDAPNVTGVIQQGAWACTTGASQSSVYVGIYTGTPASRTLTYTTASANATAMQVALDYAAAAAALSGTGTLSAAPTPALSGPAALTGTGALAAVPTPALPAAAVLSSIGSLADIALPAVGMTAALGGSGSLAAPALPALPDSAGLSGAGSLAASPSSLAETGVAILSGAGALTAVPAPGMADAAALSGTGALAAPGAPSLADSAVLAGTGALSAVPTVTGASPAALSGSGALSAPGSPSPSAGAVLSGSGTLAELGLPAATGTAALSGSGTLSEHGAPSPGTGAALSGTGSLGALGSGFSGTAVLAGGGALSAGALPAIGSPAALSGLGTLAAVGAAQLADAANLSGMGQLLALGVPSVLGLGALGSEGELSVSGVAHGPPRDILVASGPAVQGWASGAVAGSGYGTGPATEGGRYASGAVAGPGYAAGPTVIRYSSGATSE